MVACQRRHMRTHALGGTQAPEQCVRVACPELVVSREANPSAGRDRARLRLGDVVQERAEAQSNATRHLVGERLVE